MFKLHKNEWIIYLLLPIALYFIFFQHLDSFHLLNWDESIFAVNACEMIKNHNWFGFFYKGAPDLFNTKPPMQVWLQVLFIKLLGYNELAIRLPSALAAMSSGILLFYFFRKRASLLLALCVLLIYLTSFGATTFHTGRTGDADSLLAFFILCYCLSFYKWLFENKQSSLLYFFVFLSLAFLTKSIAALLLLPALFIAVLYFKKVKSIFTTPFFYFGILLFLISSVGYLYLREISNPGYIKLLISNDIGRYQNVLDSHKEPDDFYFNCLYEGRFSWIALILPGILLMYLNPFFKSVSIYAGLLLFSYFFIISFSVSKVQWYDLPLYPIMSLFCGYVIYVLILKCNPLHNMYLSVALFCCVFGIPYYFSQRNSYKNEINPGDKKLEILNEYAYKNKGNESLSNVTFYTLYNQRALYFYKYKLNEKGLDFKITDRLDSLKENSIIIVAEDSLKQQVLTKFHPLIQEEYRSLIKVKI